MNKESCDNHIANLRKICDANRSQLDAGALSVIEHVISDLEEVRNGKFSAAAAFEISVRGLEALGVVLTLVSNVQDWMK